MKAEMEKLNMDPPSEFDSMTVRDSTFREPFKDIIIHKESDK